MATTNRVGTWLIVAGAVALVAVMGYALTLGGGGMVAPANGTAAEVAVFFPDSNSWRNFRQGAQACSERGLVDVDEQGTDKLLVRSRRSGRSIRFSWDGSLGLREIRDSLARRLEGPTPPVAVVGSTNTALTVGLAQELAEHDSASGRPALLITAATSVRVELPEGDSGPGGATQPVELLDIAPSRSFRFCLNDERFAELVVGLLADARREKPAEAVLVADPFDPFSRDLATFFERSVGRRFPDLAITRSEPRPGFDPILGPSQDEVGLAESIWKKAASAMDGRPVWVLLTTQGDPARRLLEVLRAKAPAKPPKNLRVLCGDGIGRQTLCAFAGSLPFPVFSTASTSATVSKIPTLSRTGTGQIEAEIVAALIACLDEGRPVEELASSLAGLEIPADSPGSMGRSLAFKQGERAGEDLGHVLEVRPDDAALLAHDPGPGGRWTDLKWTSAGWTPLPSSGEAGRR